MYKKLEKVSEKQLPEVLGSTEFKLFLVEVGWEGLPWKFIKVFINSPYVTQEILDRIVPIFRKDMLKQLDITTIPAVVKTDVLEKTALLKIQRIRYALIEALENLEKFYQREDVDMVPILKTLADDRSENIKIRVATSKLATAEILDSLSHDVSVTVRRNVAANDNTRLETVYRMLEDSDKKTAGTAKYHINRRRKKELLTKLWSI